MSQYQAALDNFLQALGEFVKINADLADTGRMMKADAAMADEITAGIKRHEPGHIEFSAFTGKRGRV